MINTLIMYGRKKSSSFGIGRAFDLVSHVTPDPSKPGQFMWNGGQTGGARIMLSPAVDRAMGAPVDAHKFTFSFWTNIHREVRSGIGHTFFGADMSAASQGGLSGVWVLGTANNTSVKGPSNPNGGHKLELRIIGRTDIRMVSGAFIDPNQWHHIYLSVDSTKTAMADRYHLLIDGKPSAFTRIVGGVEPANLDMTWYHEKFDSYYDGESFRGTLAHINLSMGALNSMAKFCYDMPSLAGSSFNSRDYSQLPGSMAACAMIMGEVVPVSEFAYDDLGIWTAKDQLDSSIFARNPVSFYMNFSDRGTQKVTANPEIAHDSAGHFKTSYATNVQDNTENKAHIDTWRGKAEATPPYIVTNP